MRYIDSGRREAEQTVGHWMNSTVDNGVSEFRCQAGYFTLGGAGILLPTLKGCAEAGTKVRLLLGSNGGATLASHISYLAGSLSIPRDNVSLGVVLFDGALFHAKVYHFVRRDGSQTAYVGSANLTEPAISGLHVEAGIILDSRTGDDVSIMNDIVTRIESWFDEQSPGLSPIGSAQDIENLLAAGHLALTPTPRNPVSADDEGGRVVGEIRQTRPRLKTLFATPSVQVAPPRERQGRAATLAPKARQQFLRHTEASFHYPQGTHLGHIFTILWHFSKDRSGTPFDDQFIRLSGSLGNGRMAAYRRQIKYKLLAAIEIGLLTDIRLVEDDAAYVPELTANGKALWDLLEPHVDPADLTLQLGADDIYSAAMPQQPQFYNNLMRQAQDAAPELRSLYQRTFLTMPAVTQMMQYLFHVERARVVTKSNIYENFFQSKAVVAFCNEMGIEPATHESAKHRCPFLLNILESCGVLNQTATSITIEKLVLGPALLGAEIEVPADAPHLLTQIVSGWPSSDGSLADTELSALRSLFGESFFTDNYYLKQFLEVPK